MKTGPDPDRLEFVCSGCGRVLLSALVAEVNASNQAKFEFLSAYMRMPASQDAYFHWYCLDCQMELLGLA
jgi:hypothetical protein